MDGLARRRTLTLLAISSLTVMSGATIAPSLPALKAHFADTPGVELLSRLVLTVPALAIALCAPLAGAVIDRFGRRPVLLAMLVVYALAGASGLLLDSLGAILAGRAALGVAVASLMTAATALAGDYFQGAERERFLGRQAAFMGAGGVVFLVGGGLLADLHWRGPFAIYALSLLLIPAVIATLTPPAAQPAGAGDAPPPSMPWGRMAAVYATAALGMVAFYMIPVQLPFYIQAMGV
ncbi:MAG TPA: MFS transporter, partial [Alphaproteobacteria bacterium]|nr:MFS transporter [Alphaproteobacteria bacterium]